MIPVSEALRLCESHAPKMPSLTLPLGEALDRVLAEPALAVADMPPFVQSAMDGYAVHSDDTRDASPAKPVSLAVTGVSAAGVVKRETGLASGQACRIFTGAWVPGGADAVVRQELVRVEGDHAVLSEPVAAGNNIRARGEEMARGTRLLGAGSRLSAGRLAALAAGGLARVAVARAPRIKVLITGDEISPADRPLPLGAVYDCNGPALRAYLTAAGYGGHVDVVYVRDDEKVVEASLEKALSEGDLVVTTGGVSVGDKDLVIAAAARLDVKQVFWRVRQKPGKPLFLGVHSSGVPVLGLPGNPAAVFVGAVVYLRRLLDTMEGVNPLPDLLRKGVLAAPAQPDAKRDHWARARFRFGVDGRVELEPLPRQASHMLSNLSEADCLLYLPATGSEAPLAAGTLVDWLPID